MYKLPGAVLNDAHNRINSSQQLWGTHARQVIVYALIHSITTLSRYYHLPLAYYYPCITGAMGYREDEKLTHSHKVGEL